MEITDAMIEAAREAYRKSTGAEDHQLVGWIDDALKAALSAALSPAPVSEPVSAIVPEHCSGSAFVFVNGVLHVSKDGSGYIAVNEDDFELEDDRCEGPDGPEGSVHWITRFPAGEMTALRDFLDGQRFTSPPDLAAENARLREIAEAARGLCFGADWNNGNHVKLYGYREKLIKAVAAMYPDHPCARAALADQKGSK